jgi:hypothetical protein
MIMFQQGKPVTGKGRCAAGGVVELQDMDFRLVTEMLDKEK